MSLRTLLLAVFGIAIWSAAIATRWQTREIQSQLKMLPLQNLFNSLRGQRDLPEDSDRLALITPARRPILEVDQQGVRGPADLLWRREYVQIHVPEQQPCELRAFLVETDPDSDVYDPTPIPNADQSVTLPPGIHRLRWDARIDPTGNIIHYGVQLDDQWVIRGQQRRDWAVRPPANSTITSPGKQISAIRAVRGNRDDVLRSPGVLFPPGCRVEPTDDRVTCAGLRGGQLDRASPLAVAAVY